MSKELETGVITVGELLLYEKLLIPIYQRPYKWATKNVLQLIDDIYIHREKTAYRLGTIVIHDDGDNWNVVDGQQRTITLILLARAIINYKKPIVKNPELIEILNKIQDKLIDPKFNSEISIFNIRENYREIERRVADFDEPIIHFIFNKCEFIQFVLTDVSEAFQFFDSQNARGKDLEPHDLLKAYHLREFSKNDEEVQTKMVDLWESIGTDNLSELFAEFLYRIKGWSKGNSSRYFTKDDTELFKGINIENIENYPYTEMIRIAHFFVDRYNDNYERKIDRNISAFPFQLDHTILNGRRFFEMIVHYREVYKNYKKESTDKTKMNELAKLIIDTLDRYEGKNRTGDRYVRMLFDCALIYYIDKFGYREISKAIEKIFISTYSIRLNYQNVQMASVDNHVINSFNVFQKIRDAMNPEELLSMRLKQVEKIKSTKTREIEQIFKDLKYYEN